MAPYLLPTNLPRREQPCPRERGILRLHVPPLRPARRANFSQISSRYCAKGTLLPQLARGKALQVWVGNTKFPHGDALFDFKRTQQLPERKRKGREMAVADRVLLTGESRATSRVQIKKCGRFETSTCHKDGTHMIEALRSGGIEAPAGHRMSRRTRFRRALMNSARTAVQFLAIASCPAAQSMGFIYDRAEAPSYPCQGSLEWRLPTLLDVQ